MDNEKYRRETIESAKKVAGKKHEVSDYDSNDELDKGIAITHEQASDNYTEGTIDGKIDVVDNNGELKTHNGKALGDQSDLNNKDS
ncbi:YozQ family protein [Virgibacillus sp. DJP39]|uniref:YozQ family protein n=1 Tax=Virgibacillus sp. DJP39 TaxID=3409790 RepID=UPI003BB5738F